jgi:hypothetical protein
MKTSNPLPVDAMARLAPSPFQTPVFFLGMLRQARLAPQAGQDHLVGGCEVVHGLQLLEGKPPGHQGGF